MQRFRESNMEPDWLVWARRIQALAQTGIAYTRDAYDRGRYEALRTLAAEMLGARSGGDPARRAGLPGAPALLPEIQARRENAYFLWRSVVRISVDKASESRTARQPRSRRRDDTEQTGPARPRTRRRGSPAPELEPGGRQD
jgi:hypothetical protein